MTEKTDNTEKTKDLISWSDLETLSHDCSHTKDPERLFRSDPETSQDWRLRDGQIIDPETVSLFLTYGSKSMINRLTKRTDKRQRSLRDCLSFHNDNMENMT